MPGKRSPAKPRNVEKSVGKSVTQPGRFGGVLKVGGDHERPGRPPQMVRALLANEAIQGVGTLRQILAGEPVKQAMVPLAAVLRYATCPECDGKLKLRAETKETDVAMVSLKGVESASPGDRVRAFDAFAKYGIGTKDEVTVISPDVRSRVEQMVQLIAQQPSWESAALLDRLDAIWGDQP